MNLARQASARMFSHMTTNTQANFTMSLQNSLKDMYETINNFLLTCYQGFHHRGIVDETFKIASPQKVLL